MLTNSLRKSRVTDFTSITELLKQDDEVQLTDKQTERENRRNERYFEDELRTGMILFRKYVLKKFGGSRKKLISMGKCCSWEEFVLTTIFDINNDYGIDVDFINGISDYFLSELHNENTELTWTSYSYYYERMSKSKTIRTSKDSNLDEFFK